MDQQMWAGRTLLKYCLIQLPEIAVVVLIILLVRQWIDIPLWLGCSLVIFWVAKDVVLYPFVWRSYEWGTKKDTNPMNGLSGIAKDRLDPSGFIFVRGELWKARVIEGDVVIEKGEAVLVKGRRGLTLLVEKEDEKR